MKRHSRSIITAAIGAAGVALVTTAQAQIILLQNATATFSQSQFADFNVGKAIDGNSADNLGWAIFPGSGVDQTAVFETQLDAGFAGGSLLTFTVQSLYSNAGHNLGRFRFSITTDDRSTFADGLSTGGDVTANWFVLPPAGRRSPNRATTRSWPAAPIRAPTR